MGNDPRFPEDHGFALNPWHEVRFAEDVRCILEQKRALCMGNYYFVDPEGNTVKAEYTFGYRAHEGSLKIDLHHSSVPFEA